MAFVAWLVVVAGCAIADATLWPRFDLGGGRPNLTLLAVVVWSLLRGIQEGALAGLLGGLLLDSASGGPFGLQTLMLTVIGAIASAGEGTLYRGGLAFFAGTAVLVTVCYHGVQVLALQAVGKEAPALLQLVRVLAPSVVFNVALIPLMFTFARRFERVLGGWRQLELD